MDNLRNCRSMAVVLVTAILAACSPADPDTAAPQAVQIPQQTEGSRPNIIIILADDLGWGDIGANGQTMIRTPNIDRLAREGISLTTFYAGSNVCTPSRAALLTGRYPIRSGMQHVIMPHSTFGLPDSEITIAELLKDAGYATGMVGKWHLGHQDKYWPTAHGFDWFLGVAYSNDMAPFDLYEGKTVIESPADQTRLSATYAQAASRFIADNKDGPFLLYVAETFPHIPLFVPDERAGTSEAGLYGDVVEELDAGVGAILDALDAAGISDNTLIIFTSDNGPWFQGDAGSFRGLKGGTHEGGFRVPFLARWPDKIAAGTQNDAMTMGIDLLPTAASLAGVDLPEGVVIDGRDISGVLTAGANSPHDILFFFDGNEVAAVRDKRFRLVLRDFYRTFPVPFEQFGAIHLYDLLNDPRERFDFSREFPDRIESLMASVTAIREETEAFRIAPASPFPPQDGSAVIGPQLIPEAATQAP
jgi:arylsulfatase A